MLGEASGDIFRRDLFPLLLAIGASLPRGNQIHISDSEFLEAVFRLAAAPQTDAALATDAAKLSAAVVNKIDNDAALTSALDKIVDVVIAAPKRPSQNGNDTGNDADDSAMETDDNDDNNDLICINGVRLWIWITKALVIRSHRASKQFTAQLIQWLGRSAKKGASAQSTATTTTIASELTTAAPTNTETTTTPNELEDVSTMISRVGFVTILAEAEDVFTVRQHAISRKMYKQRFFLQTVPSLIAKKRDGDDEEDGEGRGRMKEEDLKRSEQHRLNALASMLPYLPQQALLSELPSILPVLVKVRPF